MREALAFYLRSLGYRVVGEADTAAAGIALARRQQPAILLTDIDLPDRSGIALAQTLQAERLPTSVIILAKQISLPILILAIRAGAKGFVWKQHPLEWLVANIQAVARGESLLPPDALAIAQTTRLSPDEERQIQMLQQLTPREVDIACLVARGLTNSQIAQRLSLSPVTVRNHLVRIMNKLGVNTRVQVATLVTTAGWVLPSEPTM